MTPCPKCGHQHQGARLAFICIGCPCPETPGKPLSLHVAPAFGRPHEDSADCWCRPRLDPVSRTPLWIHSLEN